jgi:hypothetical protein
MMNIKVAHSWYFQGGRRVDDEDDFGYFFFCADGSIKAEGEDPRGKWTMTGRSEEELILITITRLKDGSNIYYAGRMDGNVMNQYYDFYDSTFKSQIARVRNNDFNAGMEFALNDFERVRSDQNARIWLRSLYRTNQCLIEIYSNSVDNVVNGRMARKCALLCYFLNTRLESPVRFVHGGVFGRRLNDSYQPGRNQTNYEVVINKTQVLYNTPIFDDENYSEDDFRIAAKMFIEAVAGLSNEYLAFRNFRFLTYAPMVVGSWSVRDSYIDGRYIQLSPLGFRIPSASEYRMLVRPLVPFVIPANRVVIDGNRGGVIGGSQFVDRTVVDFGRVLPGQITSTETIILNKTGGLTREMAERQNVVNFGVLPGQSVDQFGNRRAFGNPNA